MKRTNKLLHIFITVAMMTLVSCTDYGHPLATANGDHFADSIVSAIGDARDYPRLLEVVDSFERAGKLPPIRVIFYSTIAYNMLGQHRSALSQYYKLANIDAKELRSKDDIDMCVYSYKDYVRLLCDMRRYDRALREIYNADRKLKAAGYDTFLNHHDIAQMLGESQFYLGQTAEATKSFQKSLQGVKTRLATYHDPIDYRECQKTMTAIARAYIQTDRFNEATPWIERQDSLFDAANRHPNRDSVFVDEMKADISYVKALLAHAQGRADDAEHAFAEYQSTQTAKQLGKIISSTEYLMLTQRYEEAARIFTQLDHYLLENGYKADIENLGRFMIPKYRANLLAGHLDSALHVASIVAEYYDTALVRQKKIDADLLTTVYDTEGKERQIAEQRAELSQQRLFTVAIVMVIIIIFFYIYTMQRRKAYRKLDATNRQLMLANERAKESSRMKTNFIQQISHEVRTPLNVLSGFTQVLAAPDIELDTDELQFISHKIVENSERITKLVDKMLDLSLVNSYADIECHDTVSPADVTQEAIDQSGVCQADHLEFQLQLPPEAETLTFVTNRKSAVKALVLLLDNAIKFTHPLAVKGRKDNSPKEHVTLNVSASQQQVSFTVEDTGVGIPPDQAENIFTEFVQLDEYSDGTGIGLSIARSLARHINGDITLDTSYTAGARFVMTLPL